MKRFRALTLAAAAAASLGIANADTLQMDGMQNASQFDAPGKPTRGMTQARVEASFGAPESRRAPVGDPPITRWDYAEFAVFFEYNRVIHAVSKTR